MKSNSCQRTMSERDGLWEKYCYCYVQSKQLTSSVNHHHVSRVHISLPPRAHARVCAIPIFTVCLVASLINQLISTTIMNQSTMHSFIVDVNTTQINTITLATISILSTISINYWENNMFLSMYPWRDCYLILCWLGRTKNWSTSTFFSRWERLGKPTFIIKLPNNVDFY